MPFRRFVQTGRVAVVADGANKGKLVTIVDVIDQNRVLIEGAPVDVPRGEIRLSQLHLTKFKVNIPFTASTRVVRKAWKDAAIDEKWEKSLWAQKMAYKAKRAELTDFDRFKLRRAKKIRNKIRTQVFYRIRARAKRDGTLFGKKRIAKTKPTGVQPKPPFKRPKKN